MPSFTALAAQEKVSMSSPVSRRRRQNDPIAALGIAAPPPQSPRAPRVVLATIVKDLHMAKRYLPDLFGGVVQLGIRVVFFLFLSGIASYSGTHGVDLTGKSLFVFFMSAMLPFAFMDTALHAPLQAVNSDLMNGTLEYLYSNPSSRYAYFVGTVAARGIVNLVFFFPVYAFMVFYTGAAFPAVIRYYAFDRQWNTLVPVHLEWIIMIGIAVFFTLVSRSLLILVERTAKEQGLHLI
jgi:hypothetical protein